MSKQLAVRRMSQWLRSLSGASSKLSDRGVEQPLLRELFSAEQLIEHAKSLAARHKLDPVPRPDRLLSRLTENEKVLAYAYELENRAAEKKRDLTATSDWLLDNYYVMEEQIRIARQHLPKGYSRQLPRLANSIPPSAPRVYMIALELISHVDGRVDSDNLTAFVAAYQTGTKLSLGELWAVPIMLRLALIENLRWVAGRLAARRLDFELADEWADRLIEQAESNPTKLIVKVAQMAEEDVPMSGAFVGQFSRRMQDYSTAPSFAMTWLEQRLAQEGTSTVDLVRADMTHQAIEHISMNNSIGSLRALDAMDWREFVATLSIVEQTLRSDPSDVYADMDFFSRDECRHRVEEIARQSDLSEEGVAQLAVEHAKAGMQADTTKGPLNHVGYYLVGKGFPQLQRAARVRATIRCFLKGLISRVSFPLYLAALLALSAAIAVAVLAGETWSKYLLLPAIVLSLACASQIALTIVNWVAMLCVPPRPLARMDFSKGIPTDCKTVVAVPTMLSDLSTAQELLDDLEVRYLANRDPQLTFALLTDLPDSDTEITATDQQVIECASEGIRHLNEKYRHEGRNIFYLFHRPRLWNPQEQLWMGYERKRGKLGQLNSLLLGEGENGFSVVVGDTSYLQGVKYVITLDTDTRLPRDAARELVGTIAHPLNRPRYDESSGRVVDGYSILQPRVSVSMPTARRSWYVRLFAGDVGVDPYTRAVSDVYQDLFSEGSFVGKGIYDVQAFQLCLDGRFPENLILSHDLLEGSYARAGLVTDVELYEDYPSRYSADVARRRRWIRGDWQIARYVLPGPFPQSTSSSVTTLPALSRWKIFDNLRRSLVPLCAFALLLMGWLLLKHPALWTAFVGGIYLCPVLLSLWGSYNRSTSLPWRLHLILWGKAFCRQLVQAAFNLAMLPYEAYYSTDAIIRTHIRMYITKRRLLEWTPARQSGRNTARGFVAEWRRMWMAPLFAIATTFALAYRQPYTLLVAAPILLLWFLSPVIAWWVSRPLTSRVGLVEAEQIEFLEKLARRTWSFFEVFAGREDNWLPVDNHQESPVTATAHRTSPTNMGMSLLASLTAYDFGYISCGELLESTRQTLDTMRRMQRYRGHFYNWYDTQTLQPLPPLYISTVDSGNLAGHLLTLRQGLLALPAAPILSPRMLNGLRHTLGLVADAIQSSRTEVDKKKAQLTPDIDGLMGKVRDDLASYHSNPTPSGYSSLLNRLAASANELIARLSPEPGTEIYRWTKSFQQQCRSAIDELEQLTPWLRLSSASYNGRQHGLNAALDQAVSLSSIAALEIESYDNLEDTQPERAANGGGVLAAVAEQTLSGSIREASARASQQIEAIEELAGICQELAELDYDFLYDNSRQLLAIGYNISDHRRDASFYDLLASEARLCSFVAIAQDRLPQEHWFTLGRQLTKSGREIALLSWSGSMFEYLMPLLVMPTYDGTLLDETYKAVVERQIEYGRERGVPWGISESGYNLTDARGDYQYKAFGVPGLGLKRGLSKDLVIAPYAALMALMVSPTRALVNLQSMAKLGYMGAYGLYEAIDYTASRATRASGPAIVRSYMAHHQGMSFLSMAYVLLDRPMQKRFLADPLFRATELLLQERVPNAVPLYPHATEVSEARAASVQPAELMRIITTPHTPHPEVRLLSNGRYNVMVTNSGGGYSRWNGLSLTRWREDATRDHWGQFCYIRDLTDGERWNTGYQPLMKSSSRYEAIFTQGRAEFRRWDASLETHTEIMVSAEDDVELRRITLSNNSSTSRSIELTTYAEVVLAQQSSDETHPAFSNLFVQTEIFRDRQAILCTRRPRSPGERHPWMVHLTGSQWIRSWLAFL